MLMLWRSLSDDEHQTLHIGDTITVKLLQIKGNQAQLGIIAPREMDVRRANIKNNLPRNRR